MFKIVQPDKDLYIQVRAGGFWSIPRALIVMRIADKYSVIAPNYAVLID